MLQPEVVACANSAQEPSVLNACSGGDCGEEQVGGPCLLTSLSPWGPLRHCCWECSGPPGWGRRPRALWTVGGELCIARPPDAVTGG